MRYYWLIVFLFLARHVSAQTMTRDHAYDHEISGFYDNDVYFFTDHYYTSGLELSYAQLLTGNVKDRLDRNDSLKAILSISYGHKIFTPLKIRERELVNRDRPYAGWHYISMCVLNFSRRDISNDFKLELGLTGEQSGMGAFQNFYHQATGITGPIGWDNQIPNEILINAAYTRGNRFEMSNRSDFIGQFTAMAGTGKSQLGYNLTWRLGKSNPLENTGYINSRVGNKPRIIGENDIELEEGFFFAGAEIVYVIHNTFIEGSLFDNVSPHTEEAENFLFNLHFGGHYSSDYATFQITIYRLSPEVVSGRSHYYASIGLGYRF